MLTIIRHIEYLLRDNDCVIVPSLGAFVVQRCDATYEDGKMTPARRCVGFNSLLKHNDGLLAGSLVRHNKISYAAAVELIEQEVAAVRTQLQNDRELTFGDLGVFRFSDVGCLEFIPSEFVELENLDNYGLPTFMFEKLDDGVGQTPDTIEEETSRRSMISVWGHRFIRVAASIAVLAVIALTLTTPIAIDESVDMASVATVVPKQHKVKCETPVVKKQQPQKQEKPAIAEHLQIASQPKVQNYAIIVASFSSERQAHKYVEEAGDSTLAIIEPAKGSKVYKVALCESDSRESLEKQIVDNRLADKYPGVWIAKK